MRTYGDNQVAIADVFNPVLSTLMRLVQKARQGAVKIGEVDQLDGLLQSSPLPSEDFGIAINRLSNARRYLQSSETGAACWELNTLANQIRTQANAKTVEPRRRLRR